MPQTGGQWIQFQNWTCFFLKGIGIDKFELKFATKKSTPSTYSKQVSIEKRLVPYEVMDDFKLATMLDPHFKLDWCQNDESCDVCNLHTSQVVQFAANNSSRVFRIGKFMWNWN